MRKINVVWLKKDVRLHDHAPLYHAIREELPVLLIYFFEPSVMNAPESDERHWRFAYQGVRELQAKLAGHGHCAWYFHAEVIPVFDRLTAHYNIQHIFSHEETGLAITFERDRAVSRWCKEKGIRWREFERDGIQRGIRTRQGWQKYWDHYMNSGQLQPALEKLVTVKLDLPIQADFDMPLPSSILRDHPQFQKGGEDRACELLDSFTAKRAASYLRHLARPHYSWESCSRLSPYLAHGHVSARRVYQATQKAAPRLGKDIHQFHNRLWWRCHYIQKLETEYEIEKEHINRGFEGLKKPYNPHYFKAWSTGHTGFPMIDASMRCLNQTGYLNFRMRAMLATFWSFTLWQDWRVGATYLAKVFLDFEPGIHYPQFQMQAGMTGYHPLRIFNPIVQAKKYDDYGIFIRQWVPELKTIPANFLATPRKLSTLEQAFYNLKLGVDYPYPIVNYAEATKRSKTLYWEYRKKEIVREKLPGLWKKHSLPKDIEQYQQDLFQGKDILITESIRYDPG